MKILIILLIILAATAGIFLVVYKSKEIKINRHQTSLEPFYTPPNPLPNGKPGDIIRFEPMHLKVVGGKAYRLLYRSEYGDKTPTVSSGMIFIPDTQAPAEGRNIVAWAHGTTGMGDECAPSRAINPLENMTWLSEMLDRGWVVVATDYSGLGTPGTERFLIGQDEARDVINSVRAARNFSKSDTSNHFALWGHSQGGHSVLFSAEIAEKYAPELKLVAVSAAAPAAELLPLLSEQYNTAIAWGIGPDITVSWPLAYPNIVPNQVVSEIGIRNYKRLADGCVLQEITEDLTRSFLKETYFKIDPVKNINWYEASKKQTPKPLNRNLPLLVTQGLKDNVVLPNTTALLSKKFCEGGSNLTLVWMGEVTHNQTASVSGPFVASWLQERFEGIPTVNTCNQPLPVSPALIPPKP